MYRGLAVPYITPLQVSLMQCNVFLAEYFKTDDIDVVVQISEHDGISVLVDSPVLPTIAGCQQDFQVHSTAVSRITHSSLTFIPMTVC